MEEEEKTFAHTFQKGKEYVDTQLTLLKLRALDRGARVSGSITLDLTKVLIGLFVLFFCSLALGFFMGELLGSNALGFFLTGVLFLAVFVVVRLFEPKLEACFTDRIIRKVTEKWAEEDAAENNNKVNTDGSDGLGKDK